MKKSIVALVILCSILFVPVFVSAQTAPSQQEVTQQLITILTQLIAQLQQEIQQILALQQHTAPVVIAPTPTPVQPLPPAQIQTASPMLEAFVVSSCPFGLQMQRAMADAVKNIPSLASNVTVKYIGSISNGVVSSMHGSDEAAENLRQICIREEQPSVFWNYIACYIQKNAGTASSGMPIGDSAGCQASTGVDTGKLASCVSDSSRGLAYAKKDFDEGVKYNIEGSPTLVLNGAEVNEQSYGGRSSDAIKSIVCAGSTSQPSYCSTKLNTDQAAISFSATYASSNASASNTHCAIPAQQ